MESQAQDVTFSRDCQVVQIPYGNSVAIAEGTTGLLTQVLGGYFTVRTDAGYLVRVAGEDADAIGQEALEDKEGGSDMPLNETTNLEGRNKRVMDTLRTVYDPEIPVNIVDLGLIYDCQLTEQPDETYHAKVVMTLTAPGCGMGQILADDVEQRVAALPGVSSVQVDLVFDPPWTQERLSEAARLKLGLF